MPDCAVTNAVRKRTRMGVDERRAHLVQTARELFASRAYDEIGIGEVAAAAGISNGLLYRYFTGTDALFSAVAVESLGELVAATEPDEALPIDERSLKSFVAFVNFVEANERIYRAALVREASGDEAIREAARAARETIYTRALRQLGIEHPSGRLQLTMRAWMATADAMVLDWLEHRQVSRDGLIELMISSQLAQLAVVAGGEVG